MADRLSLEELGLKGLHVGLTQLATISDMTGQADQTANDVTGLSEPAQAMTIQAKANIGFNI